jgi:hypothetical protein
MDFNDQKKEDYADYTDWLGLNISLISETLIISVLKYNAEKASGNSSSA